MKEKQVRQQIFKMIGSLDYWPITQTDLNAPYPVAKVKKLLGQLVGATKSYPHIQGVVFALKNVLDKVVGRPPIGRPDIIVLHPKNQGIVVEVKTLGRNETSFPFTRITPEQRKWLDEWHRAGGLGYIALGVIRPAGKRDKLEHLYLVDWFVWWHMESLVRPVQASVPLVAGKGTRKALQEGALDIVTMLAPWELSRRQGAWHLPAGHTAQPSVGSGYKEDSNE